MESKPMMREKRRTFMAHALALVIATLLAYIPAMRAGLVWNDHDLTANLVFQEHGLFRVWFTTESVNYWPLVWTSYWIEYQLWGFDPAGYHIVNIVLHAIASLLIWRILKRLNVPGSWFAALLFALHPVNVESVAWVTQRKNVLGLVFFAASVLSFLRHDDRHGEGVGWMTVLWLMLAMLSKGAAAPLPVVLLLCLWVAGGGVWEPELETHPKPGISSHVRSSPPRRSRGPLEGVAQDFAPGSCRGFWSSPWS